MDFITVKSAPTLPKYILDWSLHQNRKNSILDVKRRFYSNSTIIKGFSLNSGIEEDREIVERYSYVFATLLFCRKNCLFFE